MLLPFLGVQALNAHMSCDAGGHLARPSNVTKLNGAGRDGHWCTNGHASSTGASVARLELDIAI